MNKKGIELSVNFLVTIILAITILVFGITFIGNLLGGAEDISKMTAEDLDSRIDELLCPGDERVCFGMRTKTLRIDELGIFGIRVLNVLGEDAQFSVTVTIPASGGYIPKGGTVTAIPSPPLSIVPPAGTPRTELIRNNEEASIGIGIKPPKSPQAAKPGRYIFDVVVSCDKCGTELYGKNRLYVDVP
jgi:hypothetical protein